MRSKVTALIVLISIALLIYMASYGIKIGSFQILSISELKEKNYVLEEKISEASQLTTTTYPENATTLEETYQKYIAQKNKYEDLIGVAEKVDGKIYETKQYDIGYIWRILGNYATKRNVNLGIDVQKSNVGASNYNINFSVSGKYVNISQFITDIENDSDLYFRIYNFSMSGSGEIIKATFLVKNINIDASTIN